MLSQGGLTKKEYVSPKQILFCTEPQVGVSVKLKTTTKQVVKAGTPITGDLTNRKTAFSLAATADGKNNAVGVTLHDVTCEANTDMNSECLIFGFVDIDKVDATVKALYTTEVKAALAGKVTFLSGK